MSKVAAVALSGGIDSSVAALLLKQKGYNVIGITAKMTNSIESELVLENAEAVAKKLEIPFYPVDLVQIFQEKVIDYFENSYKNGETPNPCIMCNKYVKWGDLFKYAIENLGAEYIATGHYANIKQENNIYKLYPASDEHKDQLYFLFSLSQNQLSRTLFPLSCLKKEEVKKIAFSNDLPSKSSKESQDICFIKAPVTVKKYLNNILAPKKGDFVDVKTGKKLGEHNGFWQFTIGQRKGIGLAAPQALYVTGIDALHNTVYVGFKEDLFSETLTVNNINWSYPPNNKIFEALVKIRYNMHSVPADVELRGNSCHIKFKTPVSAISRGQACVLYDINDGHLLGGGFI